MLAALFILTGANAQLAYANVAQDWAQSDSRLPLTPRLKYFKEAPGGALDYQQALKSDEWLPSDEEDMAAYRPLPHNTTMWMQVDVVNSSDTAKTRLVVIDFWALADAQLYVMDATQGRVLSHQKRPVRW